MATKYLTSAIVPSTVHSTSATGPNYTFYIKRNADGSLGVDYYAQTPGQSPFPISREQYTQGTGEDYRSIEQSIPQLVQQYGNSTKSTFASEPPTSATTTSSAAPATDYGTKILGNQTFNLDDPSQRLAYYNALKDQLTSQREQALSQLDAATKAGEKDAANQYQGYLSTLDQNLSDIDSAAKQWTKTYLQTVSGFNESKGQGDVNRQNYFAGLSPNAFQSSQATSQQYANDKYQQGLGQLADQAQGTVGLNYVNAFDPNNTNQNLSFDPSSTYGKNVASVGTQKTGLQNSFNAYQDTTKNNVQTNQNSIWDKYNQALSGNAESLGNVDIAQGNNPFQYGVQTVTPSNVAAPDLSAYTPYTNFNNLTNTSLPGNSYVKPATTSNAYTQPTLDSWLGRTNTVLPQSQKNSWFDNWMMGKVAG